MALESTLGLVGISAILAFLSVNVEFVAFRLIFLFASLQFIFLSTTEISQVAGIHSLSAVFHAGSTLMSILWGVLGIFIIIYAFDYVVDLLGWDKKRSKTFEERIKRWV